MKTPMPKIEVENELRRLLGVLMNGTREEFKKAKKDIETLWHHETEAFILGAQVAFEFLPRFSHIEKTTNKEAFASGLSFFFLALSDEHFETLQKFTLGVIQHPDGHVREAIRKTADWLFCSLTARAEPFVYPEGKEMTPEQKSGQIKGRQEYVSYVKEIEKLIDRYDTEDEDVEYIDEMKPSINKSLQQLWSRLTECRVYQRILEATRPITYEIFMKRKEIELDIISLLKETKSDFDLEDIKEIIYNEDGHDSLTDVIALFDNGQGLLELENVLETINDAWNYFPHRSLDGLSPEEKLLEYQSKQKYVE